MKVAKIKAKLTVEDKQFRLQANIKAGEKEHDIDYSIPVKTVVLIVLPMILPASKIAFLKYLPR